MPRKNRRAVDAAVPRPAGPVERTQSWRGSDYLVRSLTGRTGEAKVYRCPGCDQTVAAGVAHVVVWPADDAAASDRRHWHTPCWSARETRQPVIQRGRAAPRY